ncbi:MAG: hypothetical protein KAJ29_03330 [Alphaproteobacteria bacterium]|nr:hypothetical protein [Alphaproteobacteria bacterium]
MTDIYLLEYASVLWRRRQLFLAVFFLVFVASIIFALNWGNYRAIATVEVAPPEISVDVVEMTKHNSDTIQTMADLQISRLKQKVLSTNSLAEIITRLNLYPAQRKRIPIAYIAESMRGNINLELVSTSLANPASAQKVSALQLSAIAFIISFKYIDPYLAQQTVNELVSRFLDEDIKERRNRAKKTSAFLQSQIDVLTKSLVEQETKIAEFRAINGDIRPDALVFNQQASIAIASRLHAVQSEIMANMGLIGTLRAQLAKTDPYVRISEDGDILTTPYMQLKMLKSQYTTLTAKYGAEHPDVVKVRRQIDAMERNLDPSSLTAGLRTEIEDVQTRIYKMQDTYSAKHPDMVSLKRQKTKLEKQMKSLEKARKEKKGGNFSTEAKSDADNPTYLQIMAQIEAAEKKQTALKDQRDEVKKQQEEYSYAITENPEAEKKLAALARDYDNSIILYRELKAKKLASDISETIEQGRIGQRLTVINAPELPLKTSPSRKIFISAGFIFALICATGSVIIHQILGSSVMGVYHLESIVGVSPLATVPHIRSLEEKLISRRLYSKIIAIAFITLMALIAMFFFFVMPLDVFLILISQRMGL